MELLTNTKKDFFSLALDNKKAYLLITYSLARSTSIQILVAQVVVYDLQICQNGHQKYTFFKSG